MLAALKSIRLLTEDIQKLTSLQNTTKDVNAKLHIKKQISLNERVVCQLKKNATDFINAQPTYIQVAIEEYYFNGKSWTRTASNLPCNISADSLRISIARYCNTWNNKK